MILKPTVEDYKIIGHYLGKIVIGFALLMIIPFLLAIGYAELEPTIDYLLSMSLTLFLGVLLAGVCHTRKDLSTGHAMSVAALSWLTAMAASAIPLFLSGHYGSYLDACFETMSALTTTGLTLVTDMDGMAHAHNFWRHFVVFIGGQGMVVIALTFLFKGTAGAFRVYVGEARDEKILPNVIHTARFIWLVSLIYMILGTSVLSVSAVMGGLKPGKAIFDSLCIFMAAWGTGGFAPQSQNILFYHNFLFELGTVWIMVLGALNFAFHYVVWTGNRREVYRNIEIVTLFTSVTVILFMTAFWAADKGLYVGAMPFFRKIFYHVISAHTTTGFSTIYPRQFVNEWGYFGMLGITTAMALGGCACSTAGAIKALRVGIIYKALRQDVKKVLLPETAVVVQKFHHIKDVILEDKHVRAASLIALSYIVLYIIGTVVGTLCGYSLSESAFESVSAASNSGLSCGVTLPSMPMVLKVTYIIQMWSGRLEFMAVFALCGMIIAVFRGKK